MAVEAETITLVNRDGAPEPLIRHVIIDLMQMADFEKNPVILTRGDGIWVWDTNGRRILDGISGVFVVNVGHGNQRVIGAMKEQLDRLTFAAPTIGTSDRMLELGARLSRLTPPEMDVVKFQNSGSEAIEAAIKISRQYHKQTGSPGKYKIFSRYDSYHGATLGALAATGFPQFRTPFEPLPPGFLRFPAPHHCGCGINRQCPPCDLSCADLLDLSIRHEGPETVAAVVIEPLMNMAGALEPPAGYLQRIREICDEYNVLLIYDEIVTGFGRLGSWFAADHYGVWPDIICVGKGMTSGYATLSAAIMRQSIADVFRGLTSDRVHLQHGHTFGGNPLSCAAAIAVIEEIEEVSLLSNARTMGEKLRSGLEALRSQYPSIERVRGAGLLTAVDFTPRGEELARLNEAIHKQPMLSIGPAPSGTMRLAPPLTIASSEVDEMVGFVEAALCEVGV